MASQQEMIQLRELVEAVTGAAAARIADLESQQKADHATIEALGLRVAALERTTKNRPPDPHEGIDPGVVIPDRPKILDHVLVSPAVAPGRTDPHEGKRPE